VPQPQGAQSITVGKVFLLLLVVAPIDGDSPLSSRLPFRGTEFPVFYLAVGSTGFAGASAWTQPEENSQAAHMF
jgi:hypothetical protein